MGTALAQADTVSLGGICSPAFRVLSCAPLLHHVLLMKVAPV
jgi:hypothetical protein